MEFFDIVDNNGIPTGETVSRSEAHDKGIPHRTSHVWLARVRNGRLQILLQKRSENKDSFPGRYDISSAGHIPAGDDHVTSALRELKEELGVECSPEDLRYCGDRRISLDQEFHGKPFRDREFQRIFLLWIERDEDRFAIQEEEISEVRWFDLENCLQGVRENSFPHCLYEDELLMVKKAAEGELCAEVQPNSGQLKMSK